MSADAADRETTLSFGFVGGSSSLNPNTSSSSQLSGPEAQGLDDSNISGAGRQLVGQDLS